MSRSSLADVYPTIARWASGYGWIEFGIDGLDRPFARALDEGGTVWEGQGHYETLDEALGDLEKGLTRFMEEKAIMSKRPTKLKTPRRSGKTPGTPRAGTCRHRLVLRSIPPARR